MRQVVPTENKTNATVKKVEVKTGKPPPPKDKLHDEIRVS
jgi:hypothetical protein